MDKRSIFLLRIPQNNPKHEDAAESFFSQIAEILKGKKYILSAEIAIYGKFIWFFLTMPQSIKSAVKGQWYSQYPNAEVEEIKDYTLQIFIPQSKLTVAGCELYYDKTEFVPFNTYKNLEKNPLVGFSGIANSFKNDEVGIIQLILTPPKKENLVDKLWKKRRESSRLQVAGRSEQMPEHIALQDKKEEQSYFATTFRFLSASPDRDRGHLNLSSMITTYKKILERPKLQKLKETGMKSDGQFLKKFIDRTPSNNNPFQRLRFRCGADELATIFHLPYNEEEITQIIQIKSKKAPPPQNLPRSDQQAADIAVFGQSNYQNEKILFGLKTPDRRRHTYIVGKTGMGKSKMLELLIKSDLENNRGVVVFDPHGDLARDVLNLVPEKRLSEVVYFNPIDTDYPIGFNPMEGVGSFEFRQTVVAGFISIFKKLFGFNWNERFEHVLRYTTLALLDYPNASILGIPRMLTDNLFRQEVISYITDPLVKKFWTTEFSTWNEQYAQDAIVPIINRVGQFVANPIIRNIVGQAKTGFSLDEVMNKGKILVVNLSIGKLGEENSALLGSMLITKIWQTAYARAGVDEEQRTDVFMYVDEFQNFATTTFANILSEARKYRLNLTVAHQYMLQLSDEIRGAVFGNVGNIVSFRTGGEDAQLLAKDFEPIFSVNDFLNLDIRNFLIKMSIDGQTSKPFSGQTITFEKPTDDKLDKIVTSSRKLWAKSKKEAEVEIEKWEKGEISKKTQENVVEETIFFPEPII